MTLAPARIVVVASYNQDQSMVVERLPLTGETVVGNNFLVSHGGKGSNQAIQAARCGANVSVVAAVGDDTAGQSARTLWEQEGITAGQAIVDASLPTGVALILVDAEGRNQIAIAPGANRLIDAASLAPWADDLAVADVVVAQLECGLDAAVATFRLAKSSGRTVTILNAAPTPDGLPDELWGLTDILIVNEIEAAALSPGCGDDPGVLARRLVDRVATAVIVTTGADGAHMWARGLSSPMAMAPPAVTVIDTTGAGDAFVGAFATAISEGGDLRRALAWGVAAGALACTRRGAVSALPSGDDIRRCMAEWETPAVPVT